MKMNDRPCVWAPEQTDANVMKPRHKSFHIQNELGANAFWNLTSNEKEQKVVNKCAISAQSDKN